MDKRAVVKREKHASKSIASIVSQFWYSGISIFRSLEVDLVLNIRQLEKLEIKKQCSAEGSKATFGLTQAGAPEKSGSRSNTSQTLACWAALKILWLRYWTSQSMIWIKIAAPGTWGGGGGGGGGGGDRDKVVYSLSIW